MVIYDATHAVFSHATVKADYVYGSLRKWAGFWTGGFAWSCTEPFQIEPPTECEAQYISTRKLAMREKQRYLNGESSDGKEAYLRLFSHAEEQLDVRGTLCADPEDVKRIPFLDVERIRLRRRQNAETLLSMLEQYAIFPHLHPQDCPLFVPIVLPKTLRTTVRQHLIQHSIYCPIHWPVSNLHKLTERSRQIYDGELSLVCDQRYDRSDMIRMGQLITEFLRLEKKEWP